MKPTIIDTPGDLQDYIYARINKDLIVSGCWEWTYSLDSHGYGQNSSGLIYKKYRKNKAHQIAYIAFNGVYDLALCVLHKCHNRKCCNPGHLYLGDVQQNRKDMELARRQRSPKGSINGFAKLTEQEVLFIRDDLKGVSNNDVSLMFGIHKVTVSRLRNGHIWGHL